MEDDRDLTELPSEFHDLIPLIARWAVGDDVDRDAMMQAATGEELQQLYAAVGPRLAAIDAYLDEHDHEEVAPYLGMLAEAAVEAQMDLDSRAGS